MDFLLIGESKIKIVLNRKEAEEYSLLGTEIDGVRSRRGFWRVIQRAKESVGFDGGGDKLLIQLYPGKDMLEIFITKLGLLSDSSARLVSRSERVTLLSKSEGFYSFSSLEALVFAARAIVQSAGDVKVESDVYLLGDKYYLSVLEYGKGGDTVEFPLILEFATPITAELSAYIREHSVRITCGDGIERFSVL